MKATRAHGPPGRTFTRLAARYYRKIAITLKTLNERYGRLRHEPTQLPSLNLGFSVVGVPVSP